MASLLVSKIVMHLEIATVQFGHRSESPFYFAKLKEQMKTITESYSGIQNFFNKILILLLPLGGGKTIGSIQ